MSSVGIVVPVLLKDTKSLRFRNFCHVVKSIAEAGHAPNLIVSQQIGGERSVDVSDVARQLAPGCRVISLSTPDTKVHKSALVNRAAARFWSEWRDWTFMIDADILLDVRRVVAELENLNPEKVQAVKPFRFFIRLNMEDSEKVRAGQHIAARTAEYPQKEIVGYPGAGAWAYSRKACELVGAMDETFTGWGWEDTEFSMRIRKELTWKILSGAGFHLEHENDRAINGENFKKFVGKDPRREATPAMGLYVRRKICIISAGRGGSTALAKGLGSHPDVDMFSSRDPRPEVRGTSEMFDPIHFASQFPSSWTGKSITDYIIKMFGDIRPANNIGYKLMMGQPSHQGNQMVLKHIASQPSGYSTILVTRDDLLEQGYSYFLAQHSGKWVGEYPADLSVEIPPEALFDYIRRLVCYNAEVLRQLPRTVVVPFDMISKHWTPTTKWLLHRLGLAPMKLEQKIKPQRKKGRTLQSMVANLAQLESDWLEIKKTVMHDNPDFDEVERAAESTRRSVLK